MEYTKTSFILQPDTEINREILVSELGNVGYESFTETDECVEGYIPVADYSENALNKLFPRDFPYFHFTCTSEPIPDQNWNEEWETNYFQPFMISDTCLVRAPFHTDYPKSDYEIIIEPVMAFGTDHETTGMIITAIMNQNLKDKAVLDMGSGTGILGIFASMRGAKSVTAVDIDSWAINSTLGNAVYNNITNLEVLQGGAHCLSDKKFDFIYANIHRNILLNDMPQYKNVLNKGGELIMSGFYLDDLQTISKRADELDLQFDSFTEKEGWVAAKFTSK
ncbi:MAG: 50S ribosomal protein L11 methyltransferase [Mariniphaga sp.]